MVRVADLYALQEIDTELDTLRRMLDDARERLSEDGGLDAARAEVVLLAEEERQAAHALRETEAVVADARAHAGVVEEKLYSGSVTNSKELRDLQRDLEGLQRQVRSHEEEALAAMVRADELRNRLQAAAATTQERESEWQGEQETLTSEVKRLEGEIGSLEERRRAAESLVDRASLSLYEQLRRTRAGRAVAQIQRGACLGCHISLPSTVFQRARSGLAIVQCTSCGRILYVG
jgi:predicted  nucleic acid-binding Zn-ribbon protein